MSKLKKIIACICLFAIIFSTASAPVRAATDYQSRSTFMQWVAGSLGGLPQHLLSSLSWDNDICPDSPDGKHHAASCVYDYENGYYRCVCNYCGASYSATAREVSDAYDAYTASLPAESYTSDGKLLWHPTLADLTPEHASYYEDTWLSVGPRRFDVFSGFPVTVDGIIVRYSDNQFSFDVLSGSSPFEFGPRHFRFVVPVSGLYTLQPARMGDIVVVTNDTSYEYHPSYTQDDCSLSAGGTFEANCIVDGYYSYRSATGTIYLPTFEIVPNSLPTEDYAADTRPASIVGDYSVVGDNNQVTVDNRSIVDESTTTIYNPVTGDTTSYDSWSYDYSTRTYTMTDNTDNSVSTVTYGDEYMTINEGGNTYNIYYGTVNQNGGSDSGDNDNSDNGGGLFGKIGDLLGSLFGGVIDIFERIAAKVLDSLTRLVDTIMGKLGDVVEALLGWMDYLPGLFDGFLDFLGAVFSFLPTELVSMLSFGVAAVVFAGIIKAFRR